MVSISLVLGITWFLFIRLLGYDSVSFDDPQYVFENRYVRNGLTVEGVIWAFQSFHISWNPLTWISLMADVEWFGLHPAGLHRTNLVLHLANVLLVFLLALELRCRVWFSAIVAGLFAWHPMHVESVSWIAERKGLLGALFVLAGLICYLRYTRTSKSRYFVSSLVLLILSLMSKAMAVSFPVVLLVLDIWVLRRWNGKFRHASWYLREPFRDSNANLTQLLLEKVPFVLVAGLAAVLAHQTQQLGDAMSYAEAHYSSWTCLNNGFVGYVTYLQKFFIPNPIAILYPHPGKWETSTVALSYGILLLFAFVIVRLACGFRWTPEKGGLVAACLVYLVVLLPVIGFVPVGYHSGADRYTYLAYIPLSFGLMLVVRKLERASAGRHTVSLRACLIGFLAVLLLLSSKQVATWKNSFSVYHHAISTVPNNWPMMRNLGTAYAKLGRFDKAIPLYAQAIEIKPGISEFYYDLASAYFAAGDSPNGIRLLRQGIEFEENCEKRTAISSEVMARNGRVGEAVERFGLVQELFPENRWVAQRAEFWRHNGNRSSD